jgi:hypothetical protein
MNEMLRFCFYCGRSLVQRGTAGDLRPGLRTAFDPERRRVWTVCDRCNGWNLWFREDRLAALGRLERAAGSGARLLYRTENVALLEEGGRELIRVGKTPLPEEAWWRYGRELRRRYAHFKSRFSKIGAATYAAVSYLGTGLGLSNLTGDFSLEDDLYAGVMRWRRFGRTVWAGRVPCPRCHSVLLKLFYFRSRYLTLLPSDEGQLVVGLPCIRCDPGADDEGYRFEGALAERVLRRVLAYQHIDGASEEELLAATALIREAGSARQLISDLTAKRTQLRRLDRTRTLALEIAINETAELQQLVIEGSEIEADWRSAEELATIVDDELE